MFEELRRFVVNLNNAMTPMETETTIGRPRLRSGNSSVNSKDTERLLIPKTTTNYKAKGYTKLDNDEMGGMLSSDVDDEQVDELPRPMMLYSPAYSAQQSNSGLIENQSFSCCA